MQGTTVHFRIMTQRFLFHTQSTPFPRCDSLWRIGLGFLSAPAAMARIHQDAACIIFSSFLQKRKAVSQSCPPMETGACQELTYTNTAFSFSPSLSLSLVSHPQTNCHEAAHPQSTKIAGKPSEIHVTDLWGSSKKGKHMLPPPFKKRKGRNANISSE